ncbi:type II toxin-antitoxin system RelB/DinJ family antitoxin [Companilactobacillus nodensis]|uniref:Uncharacterized protein n=1 Tax=Companilactobacillus nodensis DSM 19682 = JCM 14932 = NBRC 107160 TaxID=1423775 RepID=A0A0R1KJ81_9LACO|nr:type II toxin-antitoxin system RelB/DinJ family antitoxin [Companilactobacillus nodensis]KRK79095.1 hypothetical protein FD03_GL001458 [Companilactobacillus nodensis DSM 19682 = JCM 14932 = NBRC 107160]
MSEARISLRIDPELKKDAQDLYSDLGLDLTTAVTMFLKQSVREQALPFKPELEDPESVQARKDAFRKDLKRYKSVDEWWDDLNA